MTRHAASAVALATLAVVGTAAHQTLSAGASAAQAVPAQTATAAAPATTTVWDRVFSDQQATRGEALYKKSCTECHRDDLSGSDGPPLRGLDFFVRWRGQTIAQMFEQVKDIMPASAPDSLPPQTYIDIMGFLFKANGVPMGATDLPADADALQRILITEKPTP